MSAASSTSSTSSGRRLLEIASESPPYSSSSGDISHLATKTVEINSQRFSLIRHPETQKQAILIQTTSKSEFISTFADFFGRIKLPDTIPQKLLDQIAFVANYLFYGEDYRLVPESTRMDGKYLSCFLKDKHSHQYAFKLPLNELDKPETLKLIINSTSLKSHGSDVK